MTSQRLPSTRTSRKTPRVLNAGTIPHAKGYRSLPLPLTIHGTDPGDLSTTIGELRVRPVNMARDARIAEGRGKVEGRFYFELLSRIAPAIPERLRRGLRGRSRGDRGSGPVRAAPGKLARAAWRPQTAGTRDHRARALAPSRSNAVLPVDQPSIMSPDACARRAHV